MACALAGSVAKFGAWLKEKRGRGCLQKIPDNLLLSAGRLEIFLQIFL